jgi:heat shock protein HtpX
MILSSQERVALLAHEIAHAVNGDAQRGKFVGGAIEMLLRWYRLLHPVDLPNLDKSWLQILWTPLNLLRFFLSGLVGLAGYTLHWLLWRDQQRAEYYADYLAAGIVGTPAILSLLDKLHYEQVFVMALHGLALQGMTERTLFADLRQRAGQLPARELERIKRLQLTGLARLDRTHPPTIYRIEMLKTLESRMPVIVMNQEQSLAVDAELKPACDNIQKQLTEQYFRGLYQGYI